MRPPSSRDAPIRPMPRGLRLSPTRAPRASTPRPQDRGRPPCPICSPLSPPLRSPAPTPRLLPPPASAPPGPRGTSAPRRAPWGTGRAAQGPGRPNALGPHTRPVVRSGLRPGRAPRGSDQEVVEGGRLRRSPLEQDRPAVVVGEVEAEPVGGLLAGGQDPGEVVRGEAEGGVVDGVVLPVEVLDPVVPGGDAKDERIGPLAADEKVVVRVAVLQVADGPAVPAADRVVPIPAVEPVVPVPAAERVVVASVQPVAAVSSVPGPLPSRPARRPCRPPVRLPRRLGRRLARTAL